MAVTTQSSDSQAEGYLSGVTGGGSNGGGNGIVADAVGCAGASILGQSIYMGLKSMVAKTVAATAGALRNVPIIANAVGDHLDLAKDAAEANTAINAIQQIKGIPIAASFNGIAYCIVNSIIDYVQKSTVAWVKSGFKGNPAFLENPEAFFRTIADKQANAFISGLTYNTNNANVCSQFRSDLGIALSESYGSRSGGQINQLSCSMAAGGSGVSVIPAPGTDPNANYWNQWNMQRQDENNLVGTYIRANEQLYRQIQQKQYTAQNEINNNNGFLSFKKCDDPAAVKRGDNSSCRTTTPGALIKSSLEDTLNIAKNRLVSAEKIDQLITNLTNTLIKKALNTILDN